jgi:hypothetical protein
MIQAILDFLCRGHGAATAAVTLTQIQSAVTDYYTKQQRTMPHNMKNSVLVALKSLHNAQIIGHVERVGYWVR